MLSSTIMLQFRNNQNPFTVRLSPVTVESAESINCGLFINSDTITADSRATLGTWQSHQRDILQEISEYSCQLART